MCKLENRPRNSAPQGRDKENRPRNSASQGCDKENRPRNSAPQTCGKENRPRNCTPQARDQDPDRFTTVTSNLIAQQEYYLGLVKDRQRTNKRVQVKSTEIGNHAYAVSSGWTWSKLAQENAKAFALDPEPSAPGEEPVVVPQRIISTDKKAAKAGTLCLALKGVPVKPTDEVDVDKTYELIPAE